MKKLFDLIIKRFPWILVGFISCLLFMVYNKYDYYRPVAYSCIDLVKTQSNFINDIRKKNSITQIQDINRVRERFFNYNKKTKLCDDKKTRKKVR